MWMARLSRKQLQLPSAMHFPAANNGNKGILEPEQQCCRMAMLVLSDRDNLLYSLAVTNASTPLWDPGDRRRFRERITSNLCSQILRSFLYPWTNILSASRDVFANSGFAKRRDWFWRKLHSRTIEGKHYIRMLEAVPIPHPANFYRLQHLIHRFSGLALRRSV